MKDNTENFEFKRASFEGNIYLIDSDDLLSKHSDKIMAIKYFGFDTETRPSFKKGDYFKVALLQLCSEDDCFLIRTHFINQFETIKAVFENHSILKVGVAIRDDIKALQKLFPFEANNFIELQDLAKKAGLKNMGLKGMTEEVLGLTISKRAKLTNWENKILSDEQKTYAATDAWIGLKLYQKIKA